MNIELTENELKAFLWFIDEYSNRLGNDVCNDLPKEVEDMFTKQDGDAIAKKYAQLNNPDLPEGPDWPLPDFCLLYYLNRKLKGWQP